MRYATLTHQLLIINIVWNKRAIATAGDFYTVQGYYHLTPQFQIHGWGGYIDAQAQGQDIS